MVLPYSAPKFLEYAVRAGAERIVLTPGQPPEFRNSKQTIESGLIRKLSQDEIIVLADELKQMEGSSASIQSGPMTRFTVAHDERNFTVAHIKHNGSTIMSVWVLTQESPAITAPESQTITAQELSGKHLGWSFRSVAYPNKNKTARAYLNEREYEASTIYHLANGSVMIGGGHLYLHPDTVLTVLDKGDS